MSTAQPSTRLAHSDADNPPPVPASLAPWVWRGASAEGYANARGQAVISSGHGVLDAQLPGGGWPLGVLSEVLIDEPASCEWRLLAPALQAVNKQGRAIFLIAPPHPPHGLHASLNARLVWVPAHTMNQALWACEQILKSGVAGAVLAWLPRAKPPALRRLQACAQTKAPVGTLAFVMRPAAARMESSPAPLRVAISLTGPGSLKLQIVKRRGPLFDGELDLPIWPDNLGLMLASKLARQAGRQGAVRSAALPAIPIPDTALEPRPLLSRPTSTSEVDHAALAGTALSHDSAA